MKKHSVKVLVLIAFIGIGMFISAPAIPTTQAWGLATHMWISDFVIDNMPSGDWKDAFEFFASDVKSGAITPDVVWQDWPNHLYYPETGQYTAHIAVERWFGFIVNNFSIGAWKEGMFAAGVMLHYFADVNMPLHTDTTWPGHSACEGDINDHLDLFSSPVFGSYTIISDPRQLTIDAATLAHTYYGDCVALYPTGVIPSPSPLTTNTTYRNIIQGQLEQALTDIRSLWYTAIQGLNAPNIPSGA
ncbi:MAG: zinc dependent phospholipase C family protein, partial [Candidatus Thorarchaeota archaeon]